MTELLLGAHCSIGGGLYTAFERASIIKANVIQIFTKNARQWSGSILSSEQVEIYKRNLKKSNVKEVISHDSYLINLAAPNPGVLMRSRAAFKEEIIRCSQIGIKYLVFHPGAHLGTGVDIGIKTIAESLNKIHEETPDIKVISTIETTAGQGSNLGSKFEEIRKIIDLVDNKKRIGVCVDTCHIFAAGYDIRSEEKYNKTFDEFKKIIGFKYLKVFHVNDCKSEFNSHVDRHEHIGKGKIGKKGFGFLINDKRFIKIPKILETPKSEDLHEDIINMNILKKLYKSPK
jgi:deoxyribonuclease IV